MNKIIMVVITVLILSVVCGCSAIGGRLVGAEEKDIDYSGIYPGMRFSYDFFFDTGSLDKRLEKDLSPEIKSLFGFVGLIDFPFSFAFDTVFLPFDVLFWLCKPSE